MLLVPFLAWLFSPAVAQTGSPRFDRREAASDFLARAWPLSEPALWLGRGSPDAEVRARCRRASPADYLAVGSVLRTEAGRRAVVLLTHPFESYGVPYADPEVVRRHSENADVLHALAALAHRLKLVGPGDVLAFEREEFDPFVDGGATAGIDSLRLKLRGLDGSCSYDEMRAAWTAAKPLWQAWK